MSEEERKKRCVICSDVVSDWVDPDWSNGRICEECYIIHNPIIEEVRESLIAIRIQRNELRSQLTAANERAEKAERILARKGYRKSCDIAACNCGDNWSHGGHAEERLHEIADEVWENGKTALQSVKDLKAMLESAETSLAAAQKEIEGLRGALLPLLAESVSVLEHLDNYIKQSEDGWFCSCCGEGLEGDGGHREDCLVNKALNMSTPCMNAEKAIGNLTGEQVLKYALRLALTPKPEAKG